jgi:DNA-binding response OmpR family regulator
MPGQALATMPAMTSPTAAQPGFTVLVYSQLPAIRAQVRSAIGRRAAPDLARIEWIECHRYDEVKAELDRGGIDVAIFDGESQPTGGMGLARQFKNEITECPAIIVLVARPQDAWLATWSLADAVITRPIDPVAAAATVADQLRARANNIPVVR